MPKKPHINQASRRERQIMDIVYQLGNATAVDVEQALPDAPANATVRKLLRNLEEKGFLRHQREGKRFVYTPTISPDKARISALDHLLDTFFQGSAARAVVALLDRSKSELSDEERKKILSMIEDLKRKGR